MRPYTTKLQSIRTTWAQCSAEATQRAKVAADELAAAIAAGDDPAVIDVLQYQADAAAATAKDRARKTKSAGDDALRNHRRAVAAARRAAQAERTGRAVAAATKAKR